ncbi:MAG: UDP-N-acetylmuramate dehydrogenase [Patescibacteria group bacterium]|nr:UDP-N-acetylmuramate dehydrogenase [Patescibacteria group bacterium]
MEDIFLKLKKEFGKKLKRNEILAPYTTFKIGGPAKYFYEANSEQEIISAIEISKKLNIFYYILGGGSNILFSDSGFDGLVIRIKNLSSEIKVSDLQIGKEYKIIRAEAGVRLSELVKYSSDNGLSGLEWAAGIPGTTGGAIRGNAGAYGGEMSNIVQRTVILQDDKTIILQNKDLYFSYRGSILKSRKLIILSAELKLKVCDKNLIKQKIEEIVKKRAQKSFFKHPNVGSIFKNPIVKNNKILEMFTKDTGLSSINGRIPAGYLIESAGIKGKTIGGAAVSGYNANFILNIKNATADNVIMLISLIKQKVRDNYGIQLEEEVELVGF